MWERGRPAENRQKVATLAEKIREYQTRHWPNSRETVSSGIEPLDRMLPGHALPLGTLVEWLAVGEGSGAATLALAAARNACRRDRMLVVVDRAGEYYPPAMDGVDLRQTLLVRPESVHDEIWAWDQSLRCRSVGAVFGRLARLDSRTYRRLALSAEAGGTLGLLVRPSAFESEPSWAHLRLRVEPRPSERARRFRVHIVRCRGAPDGWVEFEWENGAARAEPVSRMPMNVSAHCG